MNKKLSELNNTQQKRESEFFYETLREVCYSKENPNTSPNLEVILCLINKIDELESQIKELKVKLYMSTL